MQGNRNKVFVHEATPYDILQITNVGRGFVERSISSKFITFDEEGFANSLFKLISLGVLKIFIVKQEDKFAGAAGILLSPNLYNPRELLADIYFIDILPEYQKQGIAMELMKFIEAWCKEKKIIALTVSFKQEAIADRLVEKGWTKFEYKVIKKIGD